LDDISILLQFVSLEVLSKEQVAVKRSATTLHRRARQRP
jgi:hypothetical protein